MSKLTLENHALKDADGKSYRIRKLTPRECFRLMGVNDEDIDKMLNAGIAKTNLYKLAGNSIVVDCMYHLFYKLFINTTGDSKTPRQLTFNFNDNETKSI